MKWHDALIVVIVTGLLGLGVITNCYPAMANHVDVENTVFIYHRATPLALKIAGCNPGTPYKEIPKGHTVPGQIFAGTVNDFHINTVYGATLLEG